MFRVAEFGLLMASAYAKVTAGHAAGLNKEEPTTPKATKVKSEES